MSRATLSEVFADLKAAAIVTGRFEGAGAATPTYPVANPPGWTATYTSTGIYRIHFTDAYSALISAWSSLGGTTPANLAGHTLIWDDYVAKSGNTLAYREVSVYNASFALHDLVATEFVEFGFVFQNTSVRR